MISVIVPVYNVEKYLRRCVDSILAQTYRDLEVILVDDGSRDGCPQICDEYAGADRRVKVVHKENGGAASARNAGLEAASGEWIGFVDGDDFILPEMYETLYRACVERDVPVAACGRREINERGARLGYKCCLPGPAVLSKEEALRSFLGQDKAVGVAVWDKLYKRSLFEGLRFPTGMCYEDLYVTPRVLHRAERVFHVGSPLYVYLKRQNSATTRAFHARSMEEMELAKEAAAFVKEHYPELEREASFFICFRAGFPLCKAAQCRDRAMKEQMLAVLEDGRRCLPQVLRGAFTVKHKVWYLKNYAVLKLRLRRWGIGT